MPVSPGSFQNRSAISFAVSVTSTLVPSSYVNGPAPGRKIVTTGDARPRRRHARSSARLQSAAVNDQVIAEVGGTPVVLRTSVETVAVYATPGVRPEYGVSVTRRAASS